MEHSYFIVTVISLILLLFMGLCWALGYFWSKDEHQKEMIDLLNTLIDKIKDAKEFEQQKKWLLEELAKMIKDEKPVNEIEAEAQIIENVFFEDAR